MSRLRLTGPTLLTSVVLVLFAPCVGPTVAGGQAEVQAPAPTLVSALPCFSAATGSELTGEGWTPNGTVHLRGTYASGEPALDLDLTADAEGRIRFTSAVPNDTARTKTIRVIAEDRARTTAGAPLKQRQATTSFKLTWYGPFYAPWNRKGAVARPGRVRIIEASGYIGRHLGKFLYAHYIRPSGTVKSVRVGRLSGVCGGLKKRFREFDFRPVAAGTYIVTFNTTPFAGDTAYDAPGFAAVKVRRRVG